MMMKQLIIGCLLTLSLSVNAQGVVSALVEEMNQEHLAVISISGKMIKIAAATLPEKKEDKEFMKFVSNIDKIMLVSNLESNAKNNKTLAKLLKPYEELMSISESDQKITMYTKEKDGQIEEFVLCVEGEHILFVMNIIGKIDLKQLAKLSQTFEMKEMEHLDKLNKKANTKKK
jgi:hypothetical protein